MGYGVTLLSRTRAIPNTLWTLGRVPRGPRYNGGTAHGPAVGKVRIANLRNGSRTTERIENYKTFRVSDHAILDQRCPECGVYGLGVTLLSRTRASRNTLWILGRVPRGPRSNGETAHGPAVGKVRIAN